MSAESSPRWLALDVGGANIKAAHSSGECRSVPLALWKQPSQLRLVLSRLISTLPPIDLVALTMTAELCDCFVTKDSGVRFVVDAVAESLGVEREGAWDQMRVWATDGTLHPVADIMERPVLAAASNWLALAEVASRLVPDGPSLLIDIGSTTADLIPLLDGRPVPRGRTDTDRLRSCELVYAGVRRTPLCALASSLSWQGGPIGLAAELFATTLDVYLTLGELPEEPQNSETADGREATIDFARDRLARMVGADRTGFPDDHARDFAREIDRVLTDRLVSSAEAVWRGAGLDRPDAIVISGSGEFLARRVAGRVVGHGGPIISLTEAWGPAASAAGCAKALLMLAEGRR